MVIGSWAMDDGDLTGRLREWARGRYWELVGIETVSARPGLVVNRVALREEHLNYELQRCGARRGDFEPDRLGGGRCGADAA